MSKEFSICLDEDKDFFPGDIVKGTVNKSKTKKYIAAIFTLHQFK